MSKERRTAILRTIFWVAIVISFLAAINPQPPQLPGQPNDKVQNIMAFLMLGALAFVAFPRTFAYPAGVFVGWIAVALLYRSLRPRRRAARVEKPIN